MENEEKQILILDPDKAFTVRLAQQIRANGFPSVLAAPTVRDARLHQAQNQIALAFVPTAGDDKVIQALRTKQPTLRIVLMTPSPDYHVPELFSGKDASQGI